MNMNTTRYLPIQITWDNHHHASVTRHKQPHLFSLTGPTNQPFALHHQLNFLTISLPLQRAKRISTILSRTTIIIVSHTSISTVAPTHP